MIGCSRSPVSMRSYSLTRGNPLQKAPPTINFSKNNPMKTFALPTNSSIDQHRSNSTTRRTSARRSSVTIVGAFTLTELLVVISILSLLMALLAPALKKAREKGKQVMCMSNLRQIILATTAYADENGGKITSQFWDGATAKYWSRILFEQKYMTSRKVFVCPSYYPYTADSNYIYSYGMRMLNNGVAPSIRKYYEAYPVDTRILRISHIASPADFILFGDSIYLGGATPCQWHTFYNLEGDAFGGLCWIHLRHSNMANIAFVDGHIEACDENRIKAAFQAEDASGPIRVYNNLTSVQLYP